MGTFISNADQGDDHSQEYFNSAFLHEDFGPSPESHDKSHFASNNVTYQSTAIGEAVRFGEDPLEQGFGWNRALLSLRQGSPSDSSFQYQCHDSSTSASASTSSGLLGSDLMMVDGRQAANWNAEEQLQAKNLLPLTPKGDWTNQPQLMGQSDRAYQEGSFSTRPMSQLTSPITSSNLPTSIQTPPKSQFTSPLTTSDLPISNQTPPMSQATFTAPIFSYPLSAQYRPSLSIGRILEKSRVETQIPIVLTLHHMQQSIKRIHFPPSCISKPKLLTRPPPSKSPDMLELQVSLVCTSAMQDSVKRKLALDREAQPQENVEEGNQGEGMAPSNGGNVYSCAKCIKRERKRANRKKVKNIEEEEAWQRDEAKRIIVFNTEEVGSLLDLSAAPGAIKNAEATEFDLGPPHPGCSALPTSVNIELLMRITCYCRHHDEKLGFQVIFTLKDFQDNLVAQELTSTIMITDDHKAYSSSTKATLPSPPFPESTPLPGMSFFPQEPQSQLQPLSIRPTHSATDFHSFRQDFVSSQPLHNIQAGFLQGDYQPSAAVMNPSRPISPSAVSGRAPKRRKANGFENVKRSLTMTCGQVDSVSVWQGPGLACRDALPALASDISLSPDHIDVGLLPQETSNCVLNQPNRTSMMSDSRYGLLTSQQTSQCMQNPMYGQHMVTLPLSPNSSHESSHEQNRATNFVMNRSQPLVSDSQSDPSSSSAPETSNGGSQLEIVLAPASRTRGPDERVGERGPVLPEIVKITPTQGPMIGGTEITVLGTDLYPGLNIVFGNYTATTIFHHSLNCMVCILPAASHPGPVEVRCKYDCQGRPPEPRFFFTYLGNDPIHLIGVGLVLLNKKTTGVTEAAETIARRLIDEAESERMQRPGVSHQSGGLYHQVLSEHLDLFETMNVEASLLKLLDLIDLDDSVNQPCFDQQNSSGHSMLHLSVALGFRRLAAALVARGANPDLRDKNGLSPMHMASLNNHPQIFLKLRSVGGDPTLRSLRGYTPFDLAPSEEVRNIIIAVLQGQSPSCSFGLSYPLSRTQSGSSEQSKQNPQVRSRHASETAPQGLATSLAFDLGPGFGPGWALSSGNGVSAKSPLSANRSLGYHQVANERLLAAMTAWSAWRDQLTNQVQQFQQTVHRNFPNLPIPAFPPIPNLPGYQDNTLVRLLLGLVPQINIPSIARDSRDNDYHWWELLKGSTAPPPYEELYPSDKKQDGGVAVDEENNVRRLGTYNQALHDKCNALHIGKKRMSPEERKALISAHELKVKRLRNDRKLFFFWIPLLVLVLIMLLKDGVPRFWTALRDNFSCSGVYISKLTARPFWIMNNRGGGIG